MASLDTNAGVIEGLKGGERLRKKPGLHLFGNFQLLGGAPLRFEFLGDGVPLALDFTAHLIGAEQFKAVAVDVVKSGRCSAEK